MTTPDLRHASVVREHTLVLAPPLTPELRLRLAHESLPIWEKTEEALAEDGLPPPFWAFAWAGGQALARHVLDHPSLVAGTCVLDFGAGSGIAGIAAAKAGAAHVDASEIDPFAAAAIAQNAALNAVAVTALLEDVVGRDAGPAGRWDVILAADVAYEDAPARAVFAWLADCARAGVSVLIGDPGRTFLPRDQLTARTTYETPVLRELEDQDARSTTVWAFAAP